MGGEAVGAAALARAMTLARVERAEEELAVRLVTAQTAEWNGSAPVIDGAVRVDSRGSTESGAAGAGGAGNGAPDAGMDRAVGTGGSSGIDASSGIDGSVGSDGPPTGGNGFIPGPTGCLPMALEANLDFERVQGRLVRLERLGLHAALSSARQK